MSETPKIKPVWYIGLSIWMAYNVIIFATWAAVGADYTNLAGAEVILQRLVLPEVLGAIFIVFAVSRLGWWPRVLQEEQRAHPHWTMWVFLLFALAFVLILLAGTGWSEIAIWHIAMIAIACSLIGFNEEVLTRGVLIFAARGSMRHEVFVWLFSTALFGLMHVPNGFFGIGLTGSTTQAIFTFLLGSGLYLLRRVSGTILLPVMVHALWDFSTFTHQVTNPGVPLLATLIQFLTYFIALVLVAVLLFRDRKSSSKPRKANL